MKGKYEIHITFNYDVPCVDQTWSYSRIDGDPILGKGVKIYHTTYEDTESLARKKILDVLDKIPNEYIENLIRMKIEHVIFDIKY